MKLIKFLVKEVQEEMNNLDAYNGLSGIKKKIRRWNYIIQGQDNNIYHLYSYRPEKIWRNMELKCFVRDRKDKEFDIEYNSLYKQRFLSPLLFRKAKENDIQRAKKAVEFWNKELQRLEEL